MCKTERNILYFPKTKYVMAIIFDFNVFHIFLLFSAFLFYLFFILIQVLLIDFREGKGRREGAKHGLATTCMCPSREPNPQTRHVPWQGTESSTQAFAMTRNQTHNFLVYCNMLQQKATWTRDIFSILNEIHTQYMKL